MKIELTLIPENQSDVLKKMLELYSYDFTEFVNGDLNEEGSFGYPLEQYNYWTDSHRHPYFIKVDDKLAGFALVRELQEEEKGHNNHTVYSIAEFFIMRRYRRLGIGKTIAHQLFHQFKGQWRIDQVDQNYPSNQFWRNVIDDYTKGNFTEYHEKGRMFQEFQSR